MSAPWRGGRGGEDGPVRADGATERPQQDGVAHVGTAHTGHESPTGGGVQEAGAPRTGLDAVDRVLAREDEISRLPVTERAAAYEDLHRELERILSEDPGRLPHGLVGPPGGWLQR